MSAKECIDFEEAHGAHNYHPLPVVLAKGKGVHVWDTDGKQYYDCLSAYSAVNQGHCHEKIVGVMKEQAETLCLTSRAFHNNVMGPFTKFITDYFGYDKVLPMNSGVEGGETAVKICRKWSYEAREPKLAPDSANMIFMKNNFWGRTISAVSSSSDPDCYTNYGPFAPGFHLVEYNDVAALEEALKTIPNVAGVYLEPIQGEAGVIVPGDDYLNEVRRLCTEHNCLMIADEIQTGLCRTGKMLACDHWGVRPDMLVLGKALSGGCYPVSAVLADNNIMDVIKPGTHGSTYGGNPLACKVAMAALEVLRDEKLAENADMRGEQLRGLLKEACNYPWVKEVRGKGLLCAIEIHSENQPMSAWDICIKMKEAGVLAKPTHNYIIRFAPPLVVTEADVAAIAEVVKSVFAEVAAAAP